MNDDYTEEREPLNTKLMLEEAFLKNLPNTAILDAKESKHIAGAQSVVKEGSENLLLKTYGVRDNLISSFGQIKLGSGLARNVTSIINDLGEIIEELGGQAEKFDPLAHVSGLKAPDMEKNASRVVENTRDSYSIGAIEDARIDGKNIVIEFTGHTDEVRYKAVGTVTASTGWIGNEAIDYIYTPGEGKMSIKAFDGGRWVDKSSNYDIVWELFEDPMVIANVGVSESPQKNDKKKEEAKEAIPNKLNNNISDDFPIAEIENN